MDSLLGNSTVPHGITQKIQFSILGPEEILKMSVTPEGIIYPETREGGQPKLGGIMDPRQGVVEHNGRCHTCEGTMGECPGHFGHVKLTKPVFYSHYRSNVIAILKCVCWSCSKLKVHQESERVKRILHETRHDMKKRRNLMVELCKKCKTCDPKPNLESKSDGCGQIQPIKIQMTKLEMTFSFTRHVEELGGSTVKLSAERVLDILKGIDDETIAALGYNSLYSRPEWMVATVIPVLPLCARPSVISFGTARCHDDLTYKLADIVRANNQLQENIENGMANHIVEENVQLLQYHVNTMIDSSIPGLPKATQKSGRPLKSIKQRISGKEGRVRGNLMGKRVDFCARTVITPDPTISIGQVGVPRALAQVLTYPEIVTPYNIDELTRLVNNGPDYYPGASFIVKENNDRISLRRFSNVKNLQLQYGDKVERHLRDDDIVVFNRQPSLHKMSMMCHRAKVMPGLTFRLNLSVTAPYNADFDGDEMNLHLPQTMEARAEVQQLSSVGRMIVTPQNNKPVMGIVQDTLTGVYKMTQRNRFISKGDMMNLLFHLPNWDGRMPQPAILKPIPLWTGKQLFSAIIPGMVNCLKNSESGDKWMTPNDVTVLVENGELLSGTLCKKTLGTSEGSLLHVVYLEEGYKKAAEFYTNIQLVVNQWLLIEGHTVGISDMIASRDIDEKCRSLIDGAKEDVKNLKNKGNRQAYEMEVNKLLNGARDNIGDLVIKSLSPYNNFKIMVAAGSKGNTSNISQIMACVGQQNVEGRRIPFHYTNRSTPHFTKNDHGPRARGFVENSYIEGLTPSEFVFHAMAGREGIIDTAIKTSETGYIQRRLVKAMESLQVNYDGTVRNQNGHLIQLIYGEDGLAGEWVETQNIVSLDLDNKKFERKFNFDLDNARKFLSRDVIEDVSAFGLSPEEFRGEYEQLLDDRLELEKIFPGGPERIVLPCNLKRLLWNAQKIFKIKPENKSNLNPLKVIGDVKELCDKFKIVKGSDPLSLSANSNATLLMNILVRSMLSSKRVIEEFHLSSEAFDWVVGEIESRFTQSQVQPGEMVGVLAAQSIGEPATQMTLNTFHHAGISSKNITLGVPRVKEIIGVSKNPKCPSTTVFLDEEYATNEELAHDLMRDIAFTVLNDVVSSSDIIYEPGDDQTVVPEDQDIIPVWNEMGTIDPSELSAHVLRLKLDPVKMYDHGKMPITLVEDRIAETVNEVDVASYSEEGLVRLRLLKNKQENQMDDLGTMPDSTFLSLLNHSLLHDMPLKGIPSIKSVQLCQSNSSHTKEIKIMNSEGKYERPKRWYLETEGTALAELLHIDHVDVSSTISNDVVEVNRVLGIEAARESIDKELSAVLNFYGSYVNHRHMAMLCDVMTSKGFLMPISRHGINKQEIGPISLATFEQTMDVFVEAAALAQLDPLKGVSDCLMLGKLAKIGTGSFDIILDPNHFELTLDSPTDPPTFASASNGQLECTPKQDAMTPTWKGIVSPNCGGFSPVDSFNRPGFSPAWSPGAASPGYKSLSAPYSPPYSPADLLKSPTYSPTSPVYTPTQQSPASPAYSPSSPSYNQPQASHNPIGSGYSPSSPPYFSSSPNYSPVSPGYDSQTPGYSQSSPFYSPNSPVYAPSSSGYTLDDNLESMEE